MLLITANITTISIQLCNHDVQQVLPKVIWEEPITLAQLCDKVPTCYNGMPHTYPQNCRFPFDDHHPHLTHPSLDRPHSPLKTAFGSIQPFCHSTLSGHTDRQTDGIRDRSILIVLTLYWQWATR